MTSIPHELERTPDQPEDGGINDLPAGGHHAPITRGEFNQLAGIVGSTAKSVRRIEKAVIGDNPMKPDPTSLAMRVEDHEKAIGHAKWLARGAVGGVIGIILHRIFGGHS